MSTLAHAIRLLRRQPVFAITIVLTLGIGMGVTAVVLDAARRAFLSPLPYADASRLVHVSVTAAGGQELPASYPELMAFESAPTTNAIAAYTRTNRTFTSAAAPVRLAVTQVSAGFFTTLGVQLEGRSFTEAEERAGADRVTIVTDRFRRQYLPGRAVGDIIRLGGIAYEVVGVLPPDFRFDIDDPDLFIPLGLTSFDEGARDSRWLGLIARLRDGIAPRVAAADLTAALGRTGQAGVTATTVPLRTYIVGGARPALLALLAGALFVVFAAASSVANLVAARVAERRRELTIRAALGASSRSLWSLLCTELALVALAATAFAALCAAWAGMAVDRLLPASVGMRLGMMHGAASSPLLAEAAVLVMLAVAIAALAGIADVRRASRASVSDVYGSGRGAAHLTLRRWLVGEQVATSVVLLVGAALLGRSVAHLVGAPLGFRADGVLVARMSLAAERYQSSDQIVTFYDRASSVASRIPGVQSAAIIDELPLTRDTGAVMASLPTSSAESDRVKTLLRSAGPGYFETMGIALIGGRPFDSRDRASAPPVVIISRRLAAALFHEADPVGRELTFGHPTTYRIVGVVGDVRMGELDRELGPAAYTCALQDPSRSVFLVLRSRLPLSAIVPAVRDAIARLDPEVPVYGAQSIDQVRDATAAVARRNAVLFPVMLFGGLTLLVAALGVHGILRYLLVQKYREIGIRIALGADRSRIASYALRQGLVPVAAGLVVGVLVASLCAKLATSLLYGVAPLDAVAFLGAVAVIGFSGIVACALPALSAARIDAAAALAVDP